jgi:hypothetical protein
MNEQKQNTKNHNSTFDFNAEDIKLKQEMFMKKWRWLILNSPQPKHNYIRFHPKHKSKHNISESEAKQLIKLQNKDSNLFIGVKHKLQLKDILELAKSGKDEDIKDAVDFLRLHNFL